MCPLRRRPDLRKEATMPIALFSQSLFALSLDEAIHVTADLGFDAIELACCKPHFDLDLALRDPQGVARRIRDAGLKVSALSGFNSFTEPSTLGAQLEAATAFIRLAPLFQTRIVKLTPGGPGSAEATTAHWACLQQALGKLIPLAREVGVRLAFETHMRQLTDTLASTERFLAMAPADVVGLTLDVSNMAFAHEDLHEVLARLLPRTLNMHLKNGTVDAQGGWHFLALDQGLTDYAVVLKMMRDANYNGYLTLECLGLDAERAPRETAQRDLAILKRYLAQVGYQSNDRSER